MSASIWTYFTKNKDEATCKTCHRVLKIPTGTTTTLRRHLESNGHEAERKEYQTLINQNSSPSTKNIIQSKLRYLNAEKCGQKITQTQ